MAKVWMDFPRQKLAHSPDGKPNLLLNYLCLSKRPRYRKFFVESNSQLRARVTKIVFSKLKEFSRKSRRFKVDLVLAKLKHTFALFAQSCRRQAYLRQVCAHLHRQQANTAASQVLAILR